MIRAGPFLLERPLGRGGMGEVWRGVHELQGLAVAVKVLTSHAAQDPFFLSAFRNEVRAAAALNHPNVAAVYDYGQLPEETERQSAGRLRAGSPYLVMELAEHGSLERHLGRLPWEAVRVLLLCLLDALAHAHARGVVHRDLKPGNALLAGSWSDVKLTDFGLAHPYASGRAIRDDEGAVGTPAYMAPEQFESAWRDYGPWTDLYGLGCLAYALVSGEPPFGTRPPTHRAMAAHLLLPAPTLNPRCDVPEGFEGWLHALLEKDPARRFQRAADAAWALMQLGAPLARVLGEDEDPSLRGLPGEGGDTSPLGMLTPRPVDPPTTRPLAPTTRGNPTQPLPPRTEPLSPPSTRPLSERPSPLDVPDPIHLQPLEPRPFEEPLLRLPPMPATWRRGGHEAGPALAVPLLRGAGLGLLSLRVLDIVGREVERDLLWETLARVRRMGRARAVVLIGPTGTGKSRMAEWLCERAHELGAANMLKAEHSPEPAPGEGVVAMVSRALRTNGMSRQGVSARVARALSRWREGDAEVEALTDLLAPSVLSANQEPAGDRLVVLRRFLESTARERPVVVWLEDIHWSAEAVEFAHQLLEAQAFSPSAVLLLATVREDALAERPEIAASLDALMARPDVRRLQVAPLPSEASLGLIRDQLGLEAGLAGQVEGHVAGSPRFAVELVGDWAQRGLLVHGDRGYRLADGHSIDLPDDLYAVWDARVERLLAGRDDGGKAALELAAVLGLEVDGAEWREACALAGLQPPWDLVETLLGWRLARSEPPGPWAGFSFASSLLRETLIRRAREAGRWREHHHIAARLLMAAIHREGRPRPGQTERLGRHLVHAGHPESGIAPLLSAAEERFEAGELHRCAALLEERDRAIATLGLREDDARVCEGWVLWSRCALEQGKGDLAAAWAARADEAASQNGWPELRAKALWSCARIASRIGDNHEAVTLLEDAKRWAAASGDTVLLASCRRGQAEVLLELGLLDEAADGFDRAAEEHEASGDPSEVARCWIGLGNVAIRAGDPARARGFALRALGALHGRGIRWREADALLLLGDVAWQEGDAESAEAWWGQALSLHRALQTRHVPLIESRMALGDLSRGRFEEARRVLESTLTILERRGQRGMASAVHAWLLPCYAANAEWSSFDRHLAIAADMLQENGQVDVFIARTATLGGDIAYTAGQQGRARMAWSLALEQWLVLGWRDEIRSLKHLLREEPSHLEDRGL